MINCFRRVAITVKDLDAGLLPTGVMPATVVAKLTLIMMSFETGGFFILEGFSPLRLF